MESEFWIERWREGRIGFHEGKPNALLARFAQRLGSAKRILVPLSGKTEDLAWLAAQGHAVVGIELVEAAVRAFFEEHQLTPLVEAWGPFTRFTAESITLLAGDFFAGDSAWLGSVDGFYDRAALVALPPAMRERYVRHLRALVPAGSPGLVLTFEYPPELMQGPPFSVSESELREHYRGATVGLLAEVPAQLSRPDAPGPILERCFGVTL